MPVPGAPSELKPGRKVPLRAILSVVVLVIVAGGAWFLNRNNVENANVGDCASYDASNTNNMYKVVDCADAAAKYKVLTISDSSTDSCKEVAGASRSWSVNKKTVCMGEKGADPQRAVNVAKEGDCLAIKGNDALKTDCGVAEATDKVLKRLTNVSEAGADAACQDVQGTESYYTWQWTSDNAGASSLTYDVLLCLGPKK
jgi:hypothetical protein